MYSKFRRAIKRPYASNQREDSQYYYAVAIPIVRTNDPLRAAKRAYQLARRPVIIIDLREVYEYTTKINRTGRKWVYPTDLHAFQIPVSIYKCPDLELWQQFVREPLINIEEVNNE